MFFSTIVLRKIKTHFEEGTSASPPFWANCEYNSDILSVHSQSEKREIQLSCTTLSPFFIWDLSSSVYYDTDMISLIDLCLSLSTPHPPIMGLLPVIWWIANKYIYNYWQGTPILLVESSVILSQGGRSWQAFGGGKHGYETFRQARNYNFRDKCVVFARNLKFSNLTQ